MISYFRGILDSKSGDFAVIDVSGTGYGVSVPFSTAAKLPAAGKEVKLFIVESVAMYGGSIAYYGFLTEEERGIFSLLKNEVPGTGAKKALEYLDKAAKSLPDFRKAVIEKNVQSLTGIFGFGKKAAEKIAVSLKDKIGSVNISGNEKWAFEKFAPRHGDAVSGLVALGYKETYARSAVEKVVSSAEKELPVEEVIRMALKHI